MSVSFQTTPNNAKVTAISDEKLNLIGDPLPGSTRPPVLAVEFQQNHIRLRTKLNNGERDQNARQIDFNIDVATFMSFLEEMKEISRQPEAKNIVIQIKRTSYDQQSKKFSDPYVFGHLLGGKDRDGCMYIGIVRGTNEKSKNFLTVKFHFVAPEFHPVIDRATMQPAERHVVSCIIARGWLTYMIQATPMIHANIWDYAKTSIGKWEAKQIAKNGGGGYNNNGGNNNNGGGYNNNYQQSQPRQQQPAPEPSGGFDEDIPW